MMGQCGGNGCGTPSPQVLGSFHNVSSLTCSHCEQDVLIAALPAPWCSLNSLIHFGWKHLNLWIMSEPGGGARLPPGGTCRCGCFLWGRCPGRRGGGWGGSHSGVSWGGDRGGRSLARRPPAEPSWSHWTPKREAVPWGMDVNTVTPLCVALR